MWKKQGQINEREVAANESLLKPWYEGCQVTLAYCQQ